MNIKLLKDLDYRNKKVYLRVDYNVVENSKVIDEFRIEQSLPTIKELLAKNCSLILASHNGRPEGKVEKSLSLRPVAQVLANLLKRKVSFIDDCVGQEVSAEAEALKPGEIMLLENLRFHEAEEKNNSLFAKSMARLAEVYVDDAFANAHRAHASMVGVPKYLPHAAGLLMQKEFETLTGLLKSPRRPFLAVVGGAKISTKIEVLKSLIGKADIIFIGGAMANTFLQAQGFDVEKSLTEPDLIDTAREIIELSKNKKVDLILPTDLVVAKAVKPGANKRTVEVGKLEKGDIALDIGKETMRSLIPIIKKAKTIFWNGTLGYAELSDYALASKDLAYLMALRKGKAETVIGGGDTTAFVEKLGMHNRYSFVSTGGGASLELLSGKQLPALEALRT
ncbi:phosphoglycerate kinase [Candidatus Saccharibacteria bacterium]|nr:phosphoglycerate kinase [Candidatus Saccharibacteria bacterium]